MDRQQLPWVDETLDAATRSAPIAELGSVTALPGRLRKRLAVPPGRRAVVAEEGRALRVLGPGLHRLGGPAAWYRGAPARTTWALLPEQLDLAITTPRVGGQRRFVAAGDRQLVDLSFRVSCLVVDPARFFARCVQPRGRLSELDLATAVAQIILPDVEAFLAAYDARTAAEPAVQAQLEALLNAQLPARLATWGLAPQPVQALAVRPAADLAALDRQSARLEAELRAAARDAAMSRLQDEAEWRQYVQQLEEEYQLPGLSALAAPPAAAGAPPTAVAEGGEARANRLWDALQRLRAGRLAGELARGRAATDRPPLPEPVAESPSRLLQLLTWLRYGLSALGLVIVVLDVLAMDRRDPTFPTRALELALKIGAVVLAAAVTVIAQSRAARRRVAARVAAPLSLLTGGDLQKADAVVRREVSADLAQLKEHLRDVRLAVYARETADAAETLAAVKRIEDRANRLAERIGRVEYAAPAYLADLVLTPRLVHILVQEDQAVLLESRRLSDAGHHLLTETTAGSMIGGEVPALEIALQTFEKNFQNRRRVLSALEAAAPASIPQAS